MKKLLSVLLIGIIVLFSIAYFMSPYTKSARWIGIPSVYWTEFLLDFFLIVGTYLLSIAFSFYVYFVFFVNSE